jgi:hypothetical protein
LKFQVSVQSFEERNDTSIGKGVTEEESQRHKTIKLKYLRGFLRDEHNWDAYLSEFDGSCRDIVSDEIVSPLTL